MVFMQMIILAIVQGVTEFLPVSSSGHLVIGQAIMDLKEPGVTLEVMLHFGTLLAVLVIFRKDIIGLIKGFLGSLGLGEKHPYGRLAWMVLLASIPAGLVGILFYGDLMVFFDNARFAYIFLIVNGLYLTSNRFFSGGNIKLPSTGALRAIVIGLSQAISMLPGISRSGTTITTGILLKMDSKDAARFSFLMMIPAVGGATLYEAMGIKGLDTSFLLLSGGIILSFLVGYLAIKILLKVIMARKLHYFGYYCILAGILGLFFLT